MGARLAALICAGFLGGCASLEPATFSTWQIDDARPSEIPFHGIPVRNGQMVASEQGSAQSLFLALITAEPYRWVHTGIVAIEDGVAVVYEAMGTVHPSFSGPPTDSITGGVRRVTLESYINRQRFVALYDPPSSVDPVKMVAFARQNWKAHTQFDPYFDLRDPSRVYCTEFTARAMEAGGAPTRRTMPLNSNPSIHIVTDWLRVRVDTVIPAEAIVDDAHRVALLSRKHSAAQVEAYFAVKSELHRRFTPDQKLGNVFAFSSIRGLKFRPDVTEFRHAVNSEAASWNSATPAEIDERVRALAVRMLGPFDEPAPGLAGKPAPQPGG